MTNYYQSFEEGTNGTTISAANTGAPSTAFDAITISAGNTLAFDNTHVAHGSLSCKLVTLAGNNNASAQWGGTIGTTTTDWFRVYLYFTANPSITTNIYNALNVNTICGRFQVNSTGHVIAVDNAGTTQLTSTNTIPTNAWFRVEGFVTGSATVGQLEFKIFTASAGDTATALETQTSAATLNTFGSITIHRFGVSNQAGTAYWFDDCAVSTTGYVGYYNALSTTETGTGTDGGTGPSGGTHEEVGVDDAVGFP